MEVGLPALPPVLDVVGLQPPPALAPREPAPPVPVVQGPHHLGGDDPAQSADPGGVATGREQPLQMGVTGQAPDGLSREAGPGPGLRQQRAPAVAVRAGEHRGIGVHDQGGGGVPPLPTLR